jgi:hypothetical protein
MVYRAKSINIEQRFCPGAHKAPTAQADTNAHSGPFIAHAQQQVTVRMSHPAWHQAASTLPLTCATWGQLTNGT